MHYALNTERRFDRQTGARAELTTISFQLDLMLRFRLLDLTGALTKGHVLTGRCYDKVHPSLAERSPDTRAGTTQASAMAPTPSTSHTMRM